ncbi:MAG: hypothetical protein FWB95_04575 [Treponema sp.]|nr:hypothetical protein [Treponema sp.]
MAITVDKHGNIIRDNVPVSNTPRNTQPSRPYTPPAPSSYDGDIPTVIFYLITIFLSAAASWLLAGLVGVHIFDPSRPSGWLKGISKFFHSIGCYTIFFGSFAGVFWYNIKHAYYFDFKELVLSFLSGLAGSVIVGVAVFLLTIVVQIIIGIIIIGVAISFFAGG